MTGCAQLVKVECQSSESRNYEESGKYKLYTYTNDDHNIIFLSKIVLFCKNDRLITKYSNNNKPKSKIILFSLQPSDNDGIWHLYLVM